MSRLDWFTILIVSVCVVALGFLVYKTFQLMGNNQAAFSRTELATAGDSSTDASTYQSAGGAKTNETTTTESEDQDPDDDELAYEPEEVEAPEEKKTTPVSTTKKAPATEATKSTATETRVKTPSSTNSKTTPKGGIPSNYSSSTGNFMVVAGSFSQRFNADNQVARLKRLGFKNAKVEIFNGGAVATALVDRFDDRSHADQLVKALKAKGVDSFVKRKQ